MLMYLYGNQEMQFLSYLTLNDNGYDEIEQIKNVWKI